MALWEGIVGTAISAFFKQLFDRIFGIFKAKSELKRARAEGAQGAMVEVQNEQVRDLGEGLAAKQALDDRLSGNPGELRDHDDFHIPDEGSIVQPSAAPKVER